MPKVIPIEVYDEKRRRVIIVGHIRDGVFLKKVKKNHFCWKHRAFGLQLEAWTQLMENKVKQLLFHYNRKDYVISIDKATAVKIADNLGYGNQYFFKMEECECC